MVKCGYLKIIRLTAPARGISLHCECNRHTDKSTMYSPTKITSYEYNEYK